MPPAAPAAAAALLISPAARVFARDMVVVVVGGADSDRPSARAEGVMAAATGEEGFLSVGSNGVAETHSDLSAAQSVVCSVDPVSLSTCPMLPLVSLSFKSPDTPLVPAVPAVSALSDLSN